METIQDDWWLTEFSPAEGPIAYRSRDGKTAVEVQQATYGSRGLYSAVMQLAIFLEQNSSVEQVCLVLHRTRMSLPRLKEEWTASKKVLRNPIARRLKLVVVENGATWIDPDEPYFRRIARALAPASPGHEQLHGEIVPQQAGQKLYEVWKILLSRWLQNQGPIAIGELAEEVGCSYPTVRKALDKPSFRNALQTTSNRSAELRSFPHESWRELVALSNAWRNSIRFRDRSGEKPTPQGLHKRLEKIGPSHLALGGVFAARHWHSHFDLHGTPRLDVVYHAPNGKVDLEFVRKLDPALTRTNDPSEPAVLVIHPLVRTATLFVEKTEQSLPWADPVETALDLCDLSLMMQANQLLTHLRPEVRLA